jgi:hypothetical protein
LWVIKSISLFLNDLKEFLPTDRSRIRKRPAEPYKPSSKKLFQSKMHHQTYSSRQNPSNSYVYFSNCLFISITSTSGHGGALYCTSATHFLVESSSFLSCKTSSGYGGAIFFENRNSGQSVLYNVCGYDCYSTYSSGPSYQFACISVKDDVSSKNYDNCSSITRCVNEISGSSHPLRLNYGKICCPSVNISTNKCQRYSGIDCVPYSDSNSVTCSFSYSTFADNNAFGYLCIVLWRSGAKHEMKSCNVLRNTQGDISSYGIFYTLGNVMIEDSCILENNANIIFCVYSNTITLSNCTVDKTTSSGNLVIQKTVTKSFIHALKHMSTLNCHAEYDSAGTLIPNIQTPSSSKKQKLFYSCDNLFQLLRLREIALLISILIFKFIHLDVSIYP